MSDSYKSILERADQHFAEVVREQPANLLCGRGCTLCCQGLFEITAADIAMLRDALDQLEPGVRSRIEERSRFILESTSHPDLRGLSDKDKTEFLETTQAVACPNLDEKGLCLVYESRPLICRTFGLPVRTGNQYTGEECELNFTSATREQKERAAWDLLWEDQIAPEDQFTIPEAIVLLSRLPHSR